MQLYRRRNWTWTPTWTNHWTTTSSTPRITPTWPDTNSPVRARWRSTDSACWPAVDALSWIAGMDETATNRSLLTVSPWSPTFYSKRYVVSLVTSTSKLKSTYVSTRAILAALLAYFGHLPIGLMSGGRLTVSQGIRLSGSFVRLSFITLHPFVVPFPGTFLVKSQRFSVEFLNALLSGKFLEANNSFPSLISS